MAPPPDHTLAAAAPVNAGPDAALRRERIALWSALALICVWGVNFSVQKEVFTALSPGGFLKRVR